MKAGSGMASGWLVSPSSCGCRGVCQRCSDPSVSVNVLHGSAVQVHALAFQPYLGLLLLRLSAISFTAWGCDMTMLKPYCKKQTSK